MLDFLRAADYGRVSRRLILVLDDDGVAVRDRIQASLLGVALQLNREILATVCQEQAFLASREHRRDACLRTDGDHFTDILLDDHLPELVHLVSFRFMSRDHVAIRLERELLISVTVIEKVLAEARLYEVGVKFGRVRILFVRDIAPGLDLNGGLSERIRLTQKVRIIHAAASDNVFDDSFLVFKGHVAVLRKLLHELHSQSIRHVPRENLVLVGEECRLCHVFKNVPLLLKLLFPHVEDAVAFLTLQRLGQLASFPYSLQIVLLCLLGVVDLVSSVATFLGELIDEIEINGDVHVRRTAKACDECMIIELLVDEGALEEAPTVILLWVAPRVGTVCHQIVKQHVVGLVLMSALVEVYFRDLWKLTGALGDFLFTSQIIAAVFGASHLLDHLHAASAIWARDRCDEPTSILQLCHQVVRHIGHDFIIEDGVRHILLRVLRASL